MKFQGAPRTAARHSCLRGLRMTCLVQVICTHLNLGRNLYYGSIRRPGGALFLADARASWLRRIDHLSDPSQSNQTSRQLSAKSATRSLQIDQGVFILGKSPRRFPSVFHLILPSSSHRGPIPAFIRHKKHFGKTFRKYGKARKERAS